SHVKLVLGRGSCIKFWRDTWCGNEALKDAFPAVFRVARNQEASVEDLMFLSGDQVQWNITFSRAAQDWEVDIFEAFFSLVYSVKPNKQQADRLWWTPAGKGIFSVRSYYKSLSRAVNNSFPWRRLWRNKAPPKAIFFTWTAALGKILTTDNLRKCRIVILDWCCMCKRSGESVEHLLLHCETTRALWVEVFSRIELSFVMPATVVDLLASWTLPRGAQQIKEVWKMIPICIMWCIWQERNDRTFENKERSLEELRALFFRTLCLWAIALDFNGLNFHDFLVSLMST
ncbi:hypothetical protein F2P56_032204, partial [Juglans regia]